MISNQYWLYEKMFSTEKARAWLGENHYKDFFQKVCFSFKLKR